MSTSKLKKDERHKKTKELQEGNLLLTTMNGLPRYEKPPLPTWITALMGLLFGIKNVWALRLPTVFMVAVVGIYTYRVSKEQFTLENSFINGLIAISSFYIIGITIEALWDIYTHGFMLIAIYHLLFAFTL